MTSSLKHPPKNTANGRYLLQSPSFTSEETEANLRKVRQLVRNGAKDRARTWEQPHGAPRSDPPSAGHQGQQPGPRQPRQPWDGREHILWGPRGVGGIAEEGPGWHTWTCHLQGFPTQAGAPPPPTRSHAGIAAPPWSGRRHSRASEGHWAPAPHKSPWPLPTADGRGHRPPFGRRPGRPLGPQHLEHASAHFMAPAPKAPTKSGASTLFGPLCPQPWEIKNIKINYEKSEEIKTQPVNNLSSREWEG